MRIKVIIKIKLNQIQKNYIEKKTKTIDSKQKI